MLRLYSSVGDVKEASNQKPEPVATSAVTFDASCSKNAGGLIENEGNDVFTLQCLDGPFSRGVSPHFVL